MQGFAPTGIVGTGRGRECGAVYDERERESDGGAAGFYWGADGSRDPFWWSGWSGLRLAGTFATLGANGLHIHQLAPREPGAEGGEGVSEELRTASRAQAARVEADASMSRRTAIRCTFGAGGPGGLLRSHLSGKLDIIDIRVARNAPIGARAWNLK